MLELLNKDLISQADIEKLIELRIEESIDIEFKKADEISVINENSINKLSVMVSSMANTVGGHLIFGVETKRRRASGFNFISDTEISVEKLDSYIQQRIKKSIPGLKILKILFDNHPGKAVIVFNIPESRFAPHMAFDRRFYKRVNFKEQMMEEYEVRMAYNKSNVADIEFFGIINSGGIPTMHDGKYSEINFYPKFLIRNISSAIEHTYKFELYIPSALHDPSFSPLQYNFSKHDGIYSVFGISNKSPLFQEELATIIEAKLTVNRDNFHVFENENIVVKLYYSTGIKKHEYRIKDTFRYKQYELFINDFHPLSKGDVVIEISE